MTADAFIQVSGSDSQSFLHAQLTTDIVSMKEGEHRLSAWCDASGRVITTLQILKRPDSFLLKLPASLSDAVSRRLQMFILRADVRLRPLPTWISATWDREIVAGPLLPQTNSDVFQMYPPGDGCFAQLWGESEPVCDFIASNDHKIVAPLEHRIRAAFPWLNPETTGRYQPQMLNLHWLGAIDFDKGCYPGQEVVARLQYRGQLKKQLFRLESREITEADEPGCPISDATGKQIGEIIEADVSVSDDGRSTWMAIAVINSAAAKAQRIEHHGYLLDVVTPDYVTSP